jgi:transposase
VTGPRGVDGAKRLRRQTPRAGGLRRPARRSLVTPADVQDQAAFPTLLRRAKPIAPTITHVWLDNGYTGQMVANATAKASVTVDVVFGPKPGRGFIVQPRRWAVEPTNGSINHCCRLDRHYEITLENPRRIPHSQPNRPTTRTTRPQPVVRHA